MGDPTKLTRAIMAKPPRPFNLRFSNHSNVERHCWASASGQKLLALLLVLGMIGWFNQDYFKEQYYWQAVMGPNVLTAAEERALKPGDQFTECGKGCPTMVVIPAGTFTMGSPAGEGQENEHLQHERKMPNRSQSGNTS